MKNIKLEEGGHVFTSRVALLGLAAYIAIGLCIAIPLMLF